MVRTISLEDARGRELFHGISLLRSDPPPPAENSQPSDAPSDGDEASEASGVRMRSDLGVAPESARESHP